MTDLSIADRRAIRAASPRGVEDGWARLRRYRDADLWVGRTNRYRERTTERLTADLKVRPISVNARHLGGYAAAAVPLHCMDGWGFLSAAIASDVAGDPDRARHMAYYAELRGALSLLASQGVGIFANRHVTIDDAGGAHPLAPKLGTHKVTWLALQYWSSRAACLGLLRAIIRPGGAPLEDWVAAVPGTAGFAAVGSTWLRQWGLDLKRLSLDQVARNEASYRPTRLRGQRSPSADQSATYLEEMWTLLDPFPESPFELLDRHLLRLSVERAGGRLLTQAEAAALVGLVMGESGESEAMSAFLSRQQAPATPTLFEDATRMDRIDAPRHHLQVIARALLLLRVATGAATAMLISDGCQWSDVAFWWSHLGADRGYWVPDGSPDPLTALHQDVGDALIALGDWRAGLAVPEFSRHALLEALPGQLRLLSETERVALWSLEALA